MNKKEMIDTMIQRHGQLSELCVAALENHSKILTLDKGHVLVREGDFSDKIFYIGIGNARAYYLKDGKDISDWFAFEGDFISSIQSYFMNLPSPHFVETIEPSVLLMLGRDDADAIADEFREFDRLRSKVITETLLKLQQRVVSLQFESARQKYENLLAVKPDIELRVPLMHIASYLGITLETLSRIRHGKGRI